MTGASRRLCILPRPSGVGGMVSFRRRLGRGLTARGIEVCDEWDSESADAILVIGGTRRLTDLYRARRRGVPIVQRPPLARALYAGAEVGQEVPPALYRAVAELLAYVYQLAGRTVPAG